MTAMPNTSSAVVTLALILQLVPLAGAQTSRPRADPRAKADALVRPRIEKKQAVGIALGMWHDGKALELCYGKRAADTDEPVDASTLFEIGSITKTFTGVLLADSVARDKVALSDPVTKLLPPDLKLEQKGRPMTMLDLATHASGLPRLPSNLDARAEDPYAAYAEQMLFDFLGKWKPRTEPGTALAYSNLGIGL